MSEGDRVRPVKLAWLGVGLLYLFHVIWWNFMVDDAFISFRYARNLVDGLGLVYNAGELVEGYSNPLWVLLIAAGHAVGVSPPLFARVVGLVLGAATLGLVGNLARAPGSDYRGVHAAAILAATGPWAFWVGAGLDAPLFAFLVILTVWLYVRTSPEQRPPVGLFAVCALVALARPEGMVAGFVVFAALVFERRLALRRVALASLAFWIPVGGHLAWRWSYYGELLPNTYYAKVGGSMSEMVLRGLGYLRDAMMNEAMLLMVAVAFGAMLIERPSRKGRIIAGVVIGYLVFVLWAGGDGLYKHRFVGHIAPLLAVLAAAGLSKITFLDAGRRWIALVVVVCSLLMPMSADRFHLGTSLTQFQDSEQRWTSLGHALQANAPGDTLLATNVAGRLPYYAQLPTLDLLGLCDAHIARAPAPETAGYAGHERADPAYVLERMPGIIYFSVLDGGPPQRIQHRPSVAQRLSAGPLHGYAALIAASEFKQKYRPAALQMGDRHANMFVARTVDPAAWNGALHVLEWVGE